MVNHKIAIIKSIVWRVLGVFVLGAVTFFYTRQWVVTTKIALVHHSVFLVVFYLHDILWDKIKKIYLLKSTKRLNITKSFTYEIILGMGLGGLIVFLFTDSFPLVTKITGTYTFIKLIMYYYYDQL